MAGVADIMAKYTGSPEPGADDAGGPSEPDGDEGESDGDVAIAAVNKNDGAAFEEAVKRICEKHYGK